MSEAFFSAQEAISELEQWFVEQLEPGPYLEENKFIHEH